MTKHNFEDPTVQEVEIFMHKFISSIVDKYPSLLKLNIHEIAEFFVARHEDFWFIGDSEEEFKSWEMAAKREVIRNYPMIPITEALGIKLTEEQEDELYDEGFIHVVNDIRTPNIDLIEENEKFIKAIRSNDLTPTEKLAYFYISYCENFSIEKMKNDMNLSIKEIVQIKDKLDRVIWKSKEK